jgi:Raf kinase inhibitor-like YbhB/YbcL family protein
MDAVARRRALWISAAVTLLVASCDSAPTGSGEADELADLAVDDVITVSSSSFSDGDPIPIRFTCEGEDVSPPLSWEGVPAGAVELALVVDDPDVGGGPYVHWVLFGLDPVSTGVEEGAVPPNGRQAENSAGEADYKGPCPPSGDLHHYRFSVYAVDEEIAADDGAPAGEVLARIRETAVAKGTLTGTFER